MLQACICLGELRSLLYSLSGFDRGKKKSEGHRRPKLYESYEVLCVKWNQYVEISARERFKRDENTKTSEDMPGAFFFLLFFLQDSGTAENDQ